MSAKSMRKGGRQEREEAEVSLHALLLGELRELGLGPGAMEGGGAGGSVGDGAKDAGDEDEVMCEGGPHHLYYERRKGWVLRVTVDVGRGVIGKRLKFYLRTRDAAEAEKARDLVLATLKRLGLTVRLRVQGKQRGRR